MLHRILTCIKTKKQKKLIAQINIDKMNLWNATGILIMDVPKFMLFKKVYDTP